MLKFNISPSSMNAYYESPITFYYDYIVKAEADTETYECYGQGGTVVHEVLEDSEIKNPSENFERLWQEFDLDNKTGIRGSKLKKSQYLGAVLTGLKLLRNKYKTLRNEEKIEYPLVDNEKAFIKMKGIIDVQAELIETGEFVVCDWKTSSRVDSGDSFKRQALFYSMLIYKKYGIVPKKSIFEYVKINKTKEYVFTEQELIDFEQEVKNFADIIVKKGTDMSQYELGDSGSIFNKHRLKCLAEKNRREGINPTPAIQGGDGSEVDWTKSENDEITILIQNNYCFIKPSTLVTSFLLEGLDKRMKYNQKDRYFKQKQSMVWNRGKKPANYDDIGVNHLFKKDIRRFSIGSLEKVQSIIKQYADYKKLDIEIKIEDKRDLSVRKNLGNMGHKLITDKILRDYQVESVNAFIDKGFGFLECATGSGKTLITAEIIRKLDTKTLWIIDKKELLHQTKKVFEEVLGFEVGIIGDGKQELRDITLATIQTLNKRKEQLKDYLSSINLAICDESHHASSSSYVSVFEYIRNAQYRLGTTATALRDDGESPVMFSLLGDVIYRIGTKELIEKGYLIKPKVIFYRLHDRKRAEKYSEDYTKSIVENSERNNLIKYLSNNDRKMIIITKIVDHGHYLNRLIEGSKFIYGSMDSKLRNQYMEDFREAKKGVLIATVSIASEGLDIPDLNGFMNACANKGDVKSIQGIGRVLRMIDGKGDALYIDFIDCGKYTSKHSLERMKILKREGHDVEIKEIERSLLPGGYFI